MLKSSLLYKIINGIWDMCFIWKTEMRNVFRDEGVLIFCILVPLGYPLLYSWIYNNEVVREVDTAIVDLSHSHTSREFIREYDATPDAKATYYCNSLEEPGICYDILFVCTGKGSKRTLRSEWNGWCKKLAEIPRCHNSLYIADHVLSDDHYDGKFSSGI